MSDDMPEVMRGVEAARHLGVSPQRVVQLYRSGALEKDWHPDGWAGYTAESVRRRLAAPPERTVKKPPGETWKERRSRESRTRNRILLEEARVAADSRLLITYAEACKQLGVSRRTLGRFLEQGRIRAVGPARVRRIPVEAVEWFNITR